MNEALKTLIYVGIASLVVVIAYASRPRDAERPTDDVKILFPDFKDPVAATRLEIIKVDPDVGQLERFEVARDKKTDRWSIPSHNGYPADAEEQVRDASLMFIDLKPIGLHSTVQEDHQDCGVVEPTERTASGAAKGLGTKVVIEDRLGGELAQLIIGKAVKGRENQHFVRIPGKDAVYVVQITPDKLSTRFEDWIEKDLLQLNAWDIDDVQMSDYSVLETLEPGTYQIVQRMHVDLKWDGTKSEWNLNKLLTFPGGKETPTVLAADEQLNTEKLNDLKSALDDLEIVDVFRKPEGMRADLRADQEFTKNIENIRSLVEKGFYPFRLQSGEAEMKSANGEIHVGMKDGIEYILRFGNTVKGSGDKLNRFLFVMAQFDESKFPMPERPVGLDDLQPSPQPPSAGDPTNEQPTDSAPSSSTPPNNDAAAPGGCQVEDESNEPAETPAGSDSAEPNDPAATAAPEEGAQQTPPTSVDAESQRQVLQKEYQRQIDDRNDKIKKGKQRVTELNARFADWYYVISEDIYKKVHLSRADIIKAKEGSEAVGVDAFRKLQEEGLPQ